MKTSNPKFTLSLIFAGWLLACLACGGGRVTSDVPPNQAYQDKLKDRRIQQNPAVAGDSVMTESGTRPGVLRPDRQGALVIVYPDGKTEDAGIHRLVKLPHRPGVAPEVAER